MCNQDNGSRWWLVLLFALLLLCGVRTLSAQETPSPATPSNSSASMTSTQESSPSLNVSMASLQPQWVLFRERFQDFKGSLEQFLDQVEAFGISFEDLPLYLTFLTSSLENYSTAYREVQVSMMAQLAQESLDRQKAVKARDSWRTAAIVTGSIALVSSGAVALLIIFK